MNPVNSGTVFCFACGLGVACYAIKRNVDNLVNAMFLARVGVPMWVNLDQVQKMEWGKRHGNNYPPSLGKCHQQGSTLIVWSKRVRRGVTRDRFLIGSWDLASLFFPFLKFSCSSRREDFKTSKASHIFFAMKNIVIGLLRVRKLHLWP